MLKLKLRERIRIWWTEGVWLEPLDWKIDGDELSFYKGIEGENISLWALDARGLVKLSKDKKAFVDFFKEAETASYFLGTEGIFYKKRNESIKKIYGEDFKEISVFHNLGVVCVVRNNAPDILLKITNGQIFKIMEGRIRCINSKHVNCWSWTREDEKELKIIVHEQSNKYVYHYIDKEGEIHPNRYFCNNFIELFKRVM